MEILLDENKKYFKAELHCHSTKSDGKVSVEADNTVSFPKYTVATWETEAKYDVAGGLDYFAYIRYESESAMSEPRKAHLKSSLKDTIKMAGILETIRGDKAMEELFNAMKDSCYLTLDGRPVLFIYGFDDWTADDVTRLRQMAANAGMTRRSILLL